MRYPSFWLTPPKAAIVFLILLILAINAESARVRAILFFCAYGFAFITLLFAVPWITHHIRRHRQLQHRLRNNLCLHCGYDLTGNTSGTCPECGTPIDH